MKPDDAVAPRRVIACDINQFERTMARARLLRERVGTTFSLDEMVDRGLKSYRDTIAARKS